MINAWKPGRIRDELRKWRFVNRKKLFLFRVFFPGCCMIVKCCKFLITAFFSRCFPAFWKLGIPKWTKHEEAYNRCFLTFSPRILSRVCLHLGFALQNLFHGGFSQAAAIFVPVDGYSNQLDGKKAGKLWPRDLQENGSALKRRGNIFWRLVMVSLGHIPSEGSWLRGGQHRPNRRLLGIQLALCFIA